MSYLIAIDGTDGSGKKTQTDLLCKYYRSINKNVVELSFPDYDDESSTLVKMYLNGQFGLNPEDTNAYAASMFFAADRYASFKRKWQNEYNCQNTVILLNRYTTSNAVHQLSKIDDEKEKKAFLDWLWDFEFVKLGLPVPDLTIYLNMPLAASIKLIEQRSEITGVKKDIHELSENHLKKSRIAAAYTAKKWGWETIICGDGDKPKSIEEIHKKIIDVAEKKRIELGK